MGNIIIPQPTPEGRPGHITVQDNKGVDIMEEEGTGSSNIHNKGDIMGEP